MKSPFSPVTSHSAECQLKKKANGFLYFLFSWKSIITEVNCYFVLIPLNNKKRILLVVLKIHSQVTKEVKQECDK